MIRAVQARSISSAFSSMPVLDAAVMVPVLVIELDEPHAALGQPAGQQAVRGERAVARLAAVELERSSAARRWMSISSGTLACIWNAISYWAMRVAISGSSTSASYCALSALIASTTSPCCVARDARRVAQIQHRVALAAQMHALETGSAGSPTDHCRAAIGWFWPPLPSEVSTTKPGRSSASLPRP